MNFEDAGPAGRYRRPLLIAALFVTLGSGYALPAARPAPGRQAAGEWRVTDLTGAVEYTMTGPAPPQGMCEPGTQTYRAIAEDSFIELALLDHGNQAFFADKADQELRRVMLDYADVMPALEQYGAPAVDSTRLFLFGFGFENGYHSNEVLDAAVEFSPAPDRFEFVRMVAARRDAEDQANVVGRLATVLAELNAAFGGGEGYVGSWFAEDGVGAFPAMPSPFRIVGMEGLMSGGGEAGKSLFLVVGGFDGPRSMSGQWVFAESSRLVDCTSTGSGAGTWAARAGGF